MKSLIDKILYDKDLCNFYFLYLELLSTKLYHFELFTHNDLCELLLNY
jgi:hypothetical protein